jgi:hypothetical protein
MTTTASPTRPTTVNANSTNATHPTTRATKRLRADGMEREYARWHWPALALPPGSPITPPRPPAMWIDEHRSQARLHDLTGMCTPPGPGPLRAQRAHPAGDRFCSRRASQRVIASATSPSADRPGRQDGRPQTCRRSMNTNAVPQLVERHVPTQLQRPLHRRNGRVWEALSDRSRGARPARRPRMPPRTAAIRPHSGVRMLVGGGRSCAGADAARRGRARQPPRRLMPGPRRGQHPGDFFCALIVDPARAVGPESRDWRNSGSVPLTGQALPSRSDAHPLRP